MLALIRALLAKDQDAAAEEVRPTTSLLFFCTSACSACSIPSSQSFATSLSKDSTPLCSSQGLAALFTRQGPQEQAVLEAVVIHLSPQDRAAAATSCKALAAAVRSLTTNLRIQAERDLRAAAARASEGHYPHVVCLELKSPASNAAPATRRALLSALSAKLQQTWILPHINSIHRAL